MVLGFKSLGFMVLGFRVLKPRVVGFRHWALVTEIGLLLICRQTCPKAPSKENFRRF